MGGSPCKDNNERKQCHKQVKAASYQRCKARKAVALRRSVVLNTQQVGIKGEGSTMALPSKQIFQSVREAEGISPAKECESLPATSLANIPQSLIYGHSSLALAPVSTSDEEAINALLTEDVSWAVTPLSLLPSSLPPSSPPPSSPTQIHADFVHTNSYSGPSDGDGIGSARKIHLSNADNSVRSKSPSSDSTTNEDEADPLSLESSTEFDPLEESLETDSEGSVVSCDRWAECYDEACNYMALLLGDGELEEYLHSLPLTFHIVANKPLYRFVWAYLTLAEDVRHAEVLLQTFRELSYDAMENSYFRGHNDALEVTEAFQQCFILFHAMDMKLRYMQWSFMCEKRPRWATAYEKWFKLFSLLKIPSENWTDPDRSITTPWVTCTTVATLTQPTKEPKEELSTLTKHEKLRIWTRYKLLIFLNSLDFSSFQDGHLWNLATIHDIHGDFSHVECKYRCQANPQHHLKDFPDAEYVLWFIQPYRDFGDNDADKYSEIPGIYSEEAEEWLMFYDELTQIIQPHGKEIILSIPVCYYALLVALNCQIFNLETPPMVQEKIGVDLGHHRQHKLSYCYGLQEVFSYEVVLAHCKVLDEGDWNVIHKNAVDVIQTEFGNNDRLFWEPIIVRGSPHATRHYLNGVVLIKIEEDGSIQGKNFNFIRNAEKLTAEEHNIVFVRGKEKKKSKKKTKEKDQSQEESNRAEDESVQIDSSLSSPGSSPAAPGSPGGGPEHSPTHSASENLGSNDGAGRNEVHSSGQDFESEPLDPLPFDNENDAGENRDDMFGDRNGGMTPVQHSNKRSGENCSPEPEELNANAKHQRTPGADSALAEKAEAIKELEKEYGGKVLKGISGLVDPVGVKKTLRIYLGVFGLIFLNYANKANNMIDAPKWDNTLRTATADELWAYISWGRQVIQKALGRVGVIERYPVSDAAKKFLMRDPFEGYHLEERLDWVAGHDELGPNEQEAQLTTMKVQITLLIKQGREAVENMKKKVNENGGRDGVGSSMMVIRPCSGSRFSKWGVPPFVADKPNQVVQFLDKLGGGVLDLLKNVSDGLQKGALVDLELYFEVLQYFEAVMKNHVAKFKGIVVGLQNTEKKYPHLDRLKKLQKYLKIFVVFIDCSVSDGVPQMVCLGKK
ncbi:hypothetical protein M422DRAFT_249552 [Sphaerobolus stellatus SS14]|uniref:Uncharacterized protein n=1 Tax=Sphaerobolus stellatus (strain SS14) TaxID=990650 RepID=A0A0C9W3U9_SPHS4|nr:hypothetical protein M422DRAFT_249552 [Sphaerobolus stellatus SS14]